MRFRSLYKARHVLCNRASFFSFQASFAAAVLCLPGTVPHGANLIKNGSFEAPVVASGSYQLFSTGQTLPGWRVVGAAGNVAPVSGTFKQNGFSFPAQAGRQWPDLTGISNTATGVAQTVATTPGTAYTLVFYVGNVYDPHGVFGTTSQVNVLVNGTEVFTAKNARRQGQTLVWQKFMTTLRARSTRTTISFINGDAPSDNNNGLDAVSLVRR